MQTAQLSVAISERLNARGYDVSPEDVMKRLNAPSTLIGDTVRLVTDKVVIPAALYIGGKVCDWYYGNNEVPQNALEDRNIEAVDVMPRITIALKPEQNVEPEEEFFDPEWDGFLDSDHKDPEGNGVMESGHENSVTTEATKTPDQPKAEKDVEETMVAAKKETVVTQRKAAKKNRSGTGFGSRIPRPIRRKKEMTDAEYMNKVESNLRAVEDPSKPKKVNKMRSFSRLDSLAKAKDRGKGEYTTQYQADQNWKKSLRK